MSTAWDMMKGEATDTNQIMKGLIIHVTKPGLLSVRTELKGTRIFTFKVIVWDKMEDILEEQKWIAAQLRC
jgi:hypothetical protein